MSETTCPHCGKNTITQSIPMSQSAEVQRIGLRFKARFMMRGTEEILADLCTSCGTIIRLFVKEPQRNWDVEG
ncbi:MAG TPA: hypothetical protein DCW68_02075 [Rhodospirillaceae bacterium]|nr:MAG: hypothetical protein A2018_05040 [Alphaproteobacteria bacterium GWF2_58_20]HAU28882.1 hypothetical protein [Rhodospirillaceae bacterium]